ncbi:hypothetical protein [Streptomyces sp. NPDC053726]|uniref:hypothetical protein n=1 Tax=Streptomyces sp. NPDC053726 TaxID=3365713 RepID=UPI0037D56D45
MPSQHRNPPLSVRPDPDLKAQAATALGDRDREMQSFVVACLRALVDNPDGFLGQLAEHWPQEAPRGRPRKTTTPPVCRNSAVDTNNAE